MAGDWIKMRGNLWDDPRIARICDLTSQSEAVVIGSLYWLWSTADQHTEDGILPGLTLRAIDRKTGLQGLGQALCDIGWLADHPEGVRIINFEEHNGTSAKRRCTDAQRKASFRSVSASHADNTRTEIGQKTPNLGAREEKRREEIQPKTKRERASAPPPCPDDVSEQVWSDWLALRKGRRAAVTRTVVDGATAEAAKAGMPLEEFLRIWCTRGSQGMQADWIKPAERGSSAEPEWRREQRERNEAFLGPAASRRKKQPEVIDVAKRLD